MIKGNTFTNRDRKNLVDKIFSNYEKEKNNCKKCFKESNITTCLDRETVMILRNIKKTSVSDSLGQGSGERIDLVLSLYLLFKENRARLIEAVEILEVVAINGLEVPHQDMENLLLKALVSAPREEFARNVLEKRDEWGFSQEQFEVADKLLDLGKETKTALLCLIGQCLAIKDVMKELRGQVMSVRSRIEEGLSEDVLAEIKLERKLASARWN